MPSHPGLATAQVRRGGVGLDTDDIRLIEHLCRVCQRHADLSPIGAVLTLPPPARKELLALLDQVADIDLSNSDGEPAFRAWRAAGDKLHAWAQKCGRDRSLADAFVLNRRAWRATYTLEALRVIEEPG
jgi:hypothetical protein